MLGSEETLPIASVVSTPVSADHAAAILESQRFASYTGRNVGTGDLLLSLLRVGGAMVAAVPFGAGARAWAKATGLAYGEPDVQSAASWTAWQILFFGVQQCGCLDHAKIAEVLLSKPVPTIQGQLKFDPNQQNYGDDLQAVMQIQDGGWWAVWPRPQAAEDRRLR